MSPPAPRLAPVIALVIAVAAVQGWTTERPPASGLDLQSIDRSVRPQDDLYRFANGHWLARTEIPPERVSVGTFSELADRIELDLHNLIEGLDGGGEARKIRDLYGSVLDGRPVEALGSAPLREELARIERAESPRALAKQIGRISSLGEGAPFATSAGLSGDDASAIVITINQGGLLLPERGFYLDDGTHARHVREQYLAYLTRIFALTARPGAERDARAVLGLETRLARAQATPARIRSGLDAKAFKLPQLEADLPGFPWRDWARPQGFDLVSGFILDQPDFFRAFAEAFVEVPLDTWKAWAAARYITASSIYGSTGLANARFEFFGRVLTGQQAPRERWKQGVALVNRYLGDAIGRLYVKRHFSDRSRERVHGMVRPLLATFRTAIDHADWMAPQTKRHARSKLETLAARIGYPERWRRYEGLRIDRKDLLGNVQRGRQFENDYQLARLTRRFEPREWLMSPQTINGYYSPTRNEIVLPAAMLQPPLFDPDAEDAANYGAIGALIGHEMSHAFDQRGRRFDAYGRIADWWTVQDERQFRARTAPLVKQFGGYSPLPGATVDGELTLAENIGDLIGLSVAVRAYEQSLGGRAAPVIDGFTGRQRLLVKWAQTWRERVRDEYLRQTLLYSPYPPAEYRANGAVANLDAFVEAFDVQPGDRLYRAPEHRVRIW